MQDLQLDKDDDLDDESYHFVIIRQLDNSPNIKNLQWRIAAARTSS